MPEAITVTFTEDDLEAKTSYDEFKPGEYEGTLVDVRDAKASSGNTGLRWVFQVDGLEFSITTWNQGKGGWKLAEVLRGLGEHIEPGKPVRVVPPRMLGRRATVKIGYDKSANRDDFLTVLRVMPAAVEPPNGTELVDFSEPDDSEVDDFSPMEDNYGAIA